MNVSALIIAATLTFSPFAGIIAYIVTYDEYRNHLDPKVARRQALYMGIFSFLAFVAVGLVSGYILDQFVNR